VFHRFYDTPTTAAAYNKLAVTPKLCTRHVIKYHIIKSLNEIVFDFLSILKKKKCNYSSTSENGNFDKTAIICIPIYLSAIRIIDDMLWVPAG